MTPCHVDATSAAGCLVTTRGTAVRSVPIVPKAKAASGTVKWAVTRTHTHTRPHTLPLALTLIQYTLTHTQHARSHRHTHTRGGWEDHRRAPGQVSS